jgi:hypothetical protein
VERRTKPLHCPPLWPTGQGVAGVRKALFAYNPINSYVNDVLYYAARYGGGTVLGDTQRLRLSQQHAARQ